MIPSTRVLGGYRDRPIHSRPSCDLRIGHIGQPNLRIEKLGFVRAGSFQEAIDTIEHLPCLILDVAQVLGVGGDPGKIDDVIVNGDETDDRDVSDWLRYDLPLNAHSLISSRHPGDPALCWITKLGGLLGELMDEANPVGTELNCGDLAPDLEAGLAVCCYYRLAQSPARSKDPPWPSVRRQVPPPGASR